MIPLPTRFLGFRPLANSSTHLSTVAVITKRLEPRLSLAVAALFAVLLLLGAPILGHAQYQYEVLYSFCAPGLAGYSTCTDGEDPTGILVQDASGNLYGATQQGGANGKGTVFKLDSAGHETVLYSFCSQGSSSCTDGNLPRGGLVRDSSGNLYGTTYGGGAHNEGTVFEVNSAGQETVLYSFCSQPPIGSNVCPDGALPLAGLIQDASGNLFGTTAGNGGIQGTVFKLTPPAAPQTAWTMTVIYHFCSVTSCADGSGPNSSLIRDASGNLYGTTVGGGANRPPGFGGGAGTVFKVDSAGHETVLYSFCSQGGSNCTDGAMPFYGVIRDTLGNLYGATNAGGANGNNGTVFKLDIAGHETVLYSFCSVANCADGINPDLGQLILDASGNLYGTTGGGGDNGRGTAFRLDSAGHETILYSFCATSTLQVSCTDGSFALNGLAQDVSGNLYGTALGGGANGGGGVFKLALQGVTVSPTSLNFGNVKLCEKRKKVLTLTNNGETKAQIGAVSFTDVVGNPADFTYHRYCGANLGAGKHCSIAVFFSPDATTTDTATLNIVTSAPGSPLQVPITATGIRSSKCVQ